MRELSHFTPDLQHPIPPLSYAVRVGDLLFVSGLPSSAPDGTLAMGEFETQFQHSVRTLHAVLALAGADQRRIVKANVILTRAADVADMNRLYADAFGPAPFPARTTVVVQALPHPDMLIEIECVVDMG